VNVLDTLAANLALPRGPLAGIGWADLATGRVPMPVSWADAEADTAWATGILDGYGIGPGDHCLFVTAGRDYWPRQVETAVTALGGFIGNIAPTSYEDRRLSVYLRFLPPKLIVGLSEDLAEKVADNDELVTLLKGVPRILAVPTAVRILADSGIAAKAVAAVGPALALPCAEGNGAHVDGSQFSVAQRPGSRTLTVTTTANREFQLTGGQADTQGSVLTGCGCGQPGPVLSLR
jgi:hypothetical protein